MDVELPKPEPTGRQLLVAVKAVAVNPVDTKVRAGRGKSPDAVEDPPRVLGWDASGFVEAVGPDARYSNPVMRFGMQATSRARAATPSFKSSTNVLLAEAEVAEPCRSSGAASDSDYSLRGVFRPPRNRSRGANEGQSILIIGGGGGVGSIGIQLAKHAGLIVIATASRPETEAWVKELGADHVVNHREDIVAQVRALGMQHVDHVAIFNDMRHWAAAVELIRPQGGIVSIDDTDLPMPMEDMKMKAASFHWEFMFARAMFETPDMIEQHKLLNWVADQVDAGQMRTTVSECYRPSMLRTCERLIGGSKPARPRAKSLSRVSNRRANWKASRLQQTAERTEEEIMTIGRDKSEEIYPRRRSWQRWELRCHLHLMHSFPAMRPGL